MYSCLVGTIQNSRNTFLWCVWNVFRFDLIPWGGEGIELSYTLGESRFSDHRPVCAIFAVEVDVKSLNKDRFRKGYSCAASRLVDDSTPQKHSFNSDYYSSFWEQKIWYGLYMQLWLSYFPPISENLAIRSVHSE